jgi:hypothetical protein
LTLERTERQVPALSTPSPSMRSFDE